MAKFLDTFRACSRQANKLLTVIGAEIDTVTITETGSQITAHRIYSTKSDFGDEWREVKPIKQGLLFDERLPKRGA